MNTQNMQKNVSEDVVQLFSRLPFGPKDNELKAVRRLAAEEGPADHWLETANLPNDSRTALMMAAAYIYNCVQNDPYKSSVFVRLATEALEREMKAAS